MKQRTLLCTLALLYGCSLETSEADYIEPPEETPMPAAITGKRGWSQSGQLTPGAGLNQAVSLQANFPDPSEIAQHGSSPSLIAAIGGGSQNYTVEFNMQDPNTLGDIRAQAEIIWSVEGNSVRRVVSVVSGMSVTGVGQGVKVIVRDASLLVPGGALPYQVSIQVAPGTRGSNNNPPFLEDSGQVTINPAGTAIIAVPQNAGVISVLGIVAPAVVGTALPAYSLLVDHRNASTISNKSYDPRDWEWVPISPGTVDILVTSAAAAPILTFTPVWGIDG